MSVLTEFFSNKEFAELLIDYAISGEAKYAFCTRTGAIFDCGCHKFLFGDARQSDRFYYITPGYYPRFNAVGNYIGATISYSNMDVHDSASQGFGFEVIR